MDATDQIISLLEMRVSDLEQKIVGDRPTGALSGNACDNLLLADANISAVLSGHEKVNTVMKRLEELDRYLDPMFEESCNPSQLQAKVELVIAGMPLLQQSLQILQQLRETMPVVLDSLEVKDVAQMTAQLEKLTLSVLFDKESLDQVAVKVMALLQQYSDVVSNVEELFRRWDSELSRAEHLRFTKKTID